MEHHETHRSFVSYIDRSREYYAAQGYTKADAWPRYDEVPFTRLKKPLAQSKVGLVTTAGKPHAEVKTDILGFGLETRHAYAEPTSPTPARLFTDDLGWDKQATHTEDINSFLPLDRLLECAAARRIGSVSPRFYGIPSDYSQRKTLQSHAPQILEWCREDGVDALLLPAL